MPPSSTQPPAVKGIATAPPAAADHTARGRRKTDSIATLTAAHDLSDASLGFGPRGSISEASSSTNGFVLGTNDIHFVDGHGRALLLHGINVSGSSKLPSSSSPLKSTPKSNKDGATDDDDPTVIPTFVGRPFPIEAAPLHLARLREWGLTTIRLLVTWEALQPCSPQDTDTDFIAYLHALLSLLPQYGLRAFVCAHQDVWSRACGGSGAPAWTLDLVGLDARALHDTGAAYIHHRVLAEASEASTSSMDRRERVGPFVWPSGYQKLAAGTMATVFWAGDIFAYKVRVPRSWSPLRPPAGTDSSNEEHIGLQTFLQEAYLRAFGDLADAIGGLEAVLGFEVMNEPHRGYVNLHAFDEWDYNTDLHIGFVPSFLQSVALGEGHAQLVPFYTKSFPFPTSLSHYSLLIPPKASERHPPLWRQDGPTRGQCLWRLHDVWAWDAGRSQVEFTLWQQASHRSANLRGHRDIAAAALKGKPVALRTNYFNTDPRPSQDDSEGSNVKRRIEWYRDCYAPFLSKFAERIRKRNSHLHVLFEPIPNEFLPPWRDSALVSSLKNGQASSTDQESMEQDRLEELEHAASSQTYSHASSRELIDVPRPKGSIFAPHFYDLHVLFNKAAGMMSVNVQGLSRGMFAPFALYFGEKGYHRNYCQQISNLISKGHHSLGRGPTLIGETGIPFDINSQYAYKTGDCRIQSRLLNALIGAMEAQWASFTLWNYCAENTVEDGDMWNAEDFSVMTLSPGAQDRLNTRGQRGDELYRHGRALDAIIRPYAVKIAGMPVSTSFDLKTLTFDLVWLNSINWPLRSTSQAHGDGDSAVIDRTRLTEIFWPRYHYEGRDIEVELSDGEWWLDEKKQSLYVLHADLDPGHRHSLSVVVKNKPRSGGPAIAGPQSAAMLLVGLCLAIMVAKVLAGPSST